MGRNGHLLFCNAASYLFQGQVQAVSLPWSQHAYRQLQGSQVSLTTLVTTCMQTTAGFSSLTYCPGYNIHANNGRVLKSPPLPYYSLHVDNPRALKSYTFPYILVVKPVLAFTNYLILSIQLWMSHLHDLTSQSCVSPPLSLTNDVIPECFGKT